MLISLKSCRFAYPLAALCALIAAALASCLLLAANFASASLPRAPIVAAIKDGFAQKQLQDEGWLPFNATIGMHQFNDCLVLLMAADDRAPARKRALSPLAAGFDAGERGEGWRNPCLPLRQLADGKPAPVTADSHYHRYVWGDVAVSAAMLQMLSVQHVRQLYLALSFFLPAGLLLLALRRLVNGDAQPIVTKAAALYAALLTFAFGGQFFGQSFAHFPADVLLSLYLALVLFSGPRLRNPFALAACNAVFGALTAYFELLSGGAPMGASLVLVIAAAQALDRPARDDWARMALALGAYALGVVFLFAMKFAATAEVFGWDAVAGVEGRLSTWMGAAPAGTVFAALFWQAAILGGGSLWLGASLVIGAFICLRLTIERLIREKGLASPGHWGLVAAAFGAPLWWALFPWHTGVHAWMMIRIAIGIMAGGYLLALLLYGRPLARLLATLTARISENAAPDAVAASAPSRALEPRPLSGDG